MGAYIFFKLVRPSLAQKVNDWLDKQPEQKELAKFRRGLWIWDQRDKDIELEKVRTTGRGCPDFKKIGEGVDYKTSGMGVEEHNIVLPLVAELFRKAHNQYDMKVYSGSCSLTLDYFTVEQLRWITKNGEALTGKNKREIMDLMELN